MKIHRVSYILKIVEALSAILTLKRKESITLLQDKVIPLNMERVKKRIVFLYLKNYINWS